MVKRIIKVSAVILIIIISSAGSFLLGKHTSGGSVTNSNEIALPSVIDEAIGQVQDKFYKPISKKKLESGAISGIVEALDDPFSQYLDRKNYKGFQTHMSGSYSGVGIVIETKDKKVYAIKIFDDSPAKKAGIMKGDEIVKIDSKTAGKMTIDQAANLIRGKVNSKVELTIRRDNTLKVYKLIRKNIDMPNISTTISGKNKQKKKKAEENLLKEKDIGYLILHSFTAKSGKQMEEEIDKIRAKGAKKLILDLRGNPGGELGQAIDITSLFLTKGVVLRTVNRQKDKEVFNSTGNVKFTGPMAVLVDQGSASASEIVSGALKDHKRAWIIGTKTFGKGLVQEVVNLSNGGALLITSQQWLTPSGVSISKKGIMPNQVVNEPDKQLQAAIDYLKKK